MKKNIFLTVLLLSAATMFAQKYQRIAYIDMEYILQNVPQYTEAQNALDTKVQKWRADLDKQTRAIEVLKTDLANEKAILTEDLIAEREEDIAIKQEELRELELTYFGPNGSMYNLKRQLIQPVQDQVYNAVQDIATKKNYDFVFDKSGDLVMLYLNKNHDISDLVLKAINVEQKIQTRKEAIEAKKNEVNQVEVSEEVQEKLDKKEALQKQKEEQIKAKKAEIEAKRQERLKIREEKRKLLQQKKDSILKARANK